MSHFVITFFGSSLFRGRLGVQLKNKEYFKIFSSSNSTKYSSSQLYFHETELIRFSTLDFREIQREISKEQGTFSLSKIEKSYLFIII